MYTGKLVFSKVMEFVPLHTFRRCVARYQGDYKVKKFNCLAQYLCMAFAQITYRDSLRDIEICLRAQEQKLYHMGIRGNVSRSTIAVANEQRNWKIYADLAYSLINTTRIISRRRGRSYFCFSNQQLRTAGNNNCKSLSLTLADGALLQMDQTSSAYQKLLWNIRECSQDANMDRYLRLRHCSSYPEKTASAPLQSLHGFTGSERLGFRKNPNLSTIYKNQLQSGKPYVM